MLTVLEVWLLWEAKYIFRTFSSEQPSLAPHKEHGLSFLVVVHSVLHSLFSRLRMFFSLTSILVNPYNSLTVALPSLEDLHLALYSFCWWALHSHVFKTACVVGDFSNLSLSSNVPPKAHFYLLDMPTPQAVLVQQVQNRTPRSPCSAHTSCWCSVILANWFLGPCKSSAALCCFFLRNLWSHYMSSIYLVCISLFCFHCYSLYNSFQLVSLSLCNPSFLQTVLHVNVSKTWP